MAGDSFPSQGVSRPMATLINLAEHTNKSPANVETTPESDISANFLIDKIIEGAFTATM